MDIQDRVAIVTGSASGIGRATAVALAEAGARAVVLADWNDAEETASLVAAAGAEALPVPTDVSDLESQRKLFAEVDRRYGVLHILHNNAAIGEGHDLWPDVPPERCAAIVDVNLRGVVLGTQLATRPMQRSGGGVVVSTSSGGGLIPVPQQAVYAATKAGVIHFTKSCVPMAESHGVRVNCVCPGLVDTPMVLETGGGKVAEWLRPMYEGVQLLQPDEIAAVVLEIIRDDAMVGEAVTVGNQPRA
jgi:NAD(P)-dependent dehydrogenase (short-subunit alcohol dehydrogenase family)